MPICSPPTPGWGGCFCSDRQTFAVTLQSLMLLWPRGTEPYCCKTARCQGSIPTARGKREGWARGPAAQQHFTGFKIYPPLTLQEKPHWLFRGRKG